MSKDNNSQEQQRALKLYRVDVFYLGKDNKEEPGGSMFVNATACETAEAYARGTMDAQFLMKSGIKNYPYIVRATESTKEELAEYEKKVFELFNKEKLAKKLLDETNILNFSNNKLSKDKKTNLN